MVVALSVTHYGGNAPLVLTTVDLVREKKKKKNARGPLAMLFPVTYKLIIGRKSVYGRGSGRVRGSPHTHFSRVWSIAVRGHVKTHKDLSFNWEKSNHKLV